MTINGKLYSNILLVFALESEARKEFESFNKLFVGYSIDKTEVICNPHGYLDEPDNGYDKEQIIEI